MMTMSGNTSEPFMRHPNPSTGGDFVSKRVIVCNGCCCGNISKGHSEVPIQYLEEKWEKNDISKQVELDISECLGPCSWHNVAVLEAEGQQIWVGDLSQPSHYEAIADWAKKSAYQTMVEIPSILKSNIFDPDGQD